MSCNSNNFMNIKNKDNNDLSDPFDSPYTFYDHYSNAFQNTFNNQISSSQKRVNGTNNCTPFCPMYADNNNSVPPTKQSPKWSNQRDYGNLCIQSYDPSNMVTSNCFPYNRLPPLSNKDTSPSDTNMSWCQNLDKLNNQYYN